MTDSLPNEMEIYSTIRKWKHLNSTKSGRIEFLEKTEFEIVWTVWLFLIIYQRVYIFLHGFGVISIRF